MEHYGFYWLEQIWHTLLSIHTKYKHSVATDSNCITCMSNYCYCSNRYNRYKGKLYCILQCMYLCMVYVHEMLEIHRLILWNPLLLIFYKIFRMDEGISQHLARFVCLLTYTYFCCHFLPGLNRWEDIEKLNFFPKLEEVRLQGIPLLQTYTNKERRSLMIAQWVPPRDRIG